MAVIAIRAFDLGSKWKQRAFAEARAAIAQLGERQIEDLKVPGSIPGLSIFMDLGFVENASACVPDKPFLPYGMLHVLMVFLDLDTPKA